MDYTTDYIDDTNNDDIDTKCRTLWVGNLHPKVTSRLIAELFYQAGPIDYVEFAFDEHEICENYAWVVFKHQSSVEDSIKLFSGTTLYGLPIQTKNYSKQLENPVFDEQLNYFKQLINVERSQSNNNPNRSKWNNQDSDFKNHIPESLPEPPTHDESTFGPDQDNYNYRSDTMPRHSYKDKSSKYPYNDSYTKSRNPVYGNEHGSTDKSVHGRGHYRKPEQNSRTSSMNVSNFDRNSYRNQNYDRKHRDYNNHTSSNWKESAHHNQESLFVHENNSAKDLLPVRDLRDTMHRKRSRMDSDYHNPNSNAACTSVLDLRDTIYHNKSKRYENQEQHSESDSNNRWTDRNKKKHNSFSDKDSRKNNYSSEHYNESNNKHNHYSNQEYNNRNFNQDNAYNDRNFNQDNSYNDFQEYSNEYPNNYNESFRREKNNHYNKKYNQMHPQNMESSSRPHGSFHPYKRNNDGYEKREYTNSYGDRSGHTRGKNYNKGGNDRSRQSYYS